MIAEAKFRHKLINCLDLISNNCKYFNFMNVIVSFSEVYHTTLVGFGLIRSNEPSHEQTNDLHMRKQRRRSDVQ